MNEVAVPLRRQAVEEGAHIHPNVGIGVLTDGERGGRVLDKQVHESDAKAPHFRNRVEDFVRHQVKTGRSRAKPDFGLLPEHGP